LVLRLTCLILKLSFLQCRKRFPAHIAYELDETDATARTAANFASDIVGDVVEIPSMDLINSIEGEPKD